MRKAKILATLGPASNQREIITEMLRSGLNAVRINMSHGTTEEHAETIRLARESAFPNGPTQWPVGLAHLPANIYARLFLTVLLLCGPHVRRL